MNSSPGLLATTMPSMYSMVPSSLSRMNVYVPEPVEDIVMYPARARRGVRTTAGARVQKHRTHCLSVTGRLFNR